VCKLNHKAWMKNVKKKLEEKIQRVATNTIGYTRKQANKERFDEECVKANEKKNAARERAIQIKTIGLQMNSTSVFMKVCLSICLQKKLLNYKSYTNQYGIKDVIALIRTRTIVVDFHFKI
jgi:hypothetical protein